MQMQHVDTPNILNTLKARHAAGHVYTSCGAAGIVISINPYRWIDVYGTDVMRDHYESFGTKELEPHVFALASDAYKTLCIHGRSQCLVTSGESGSGKTENSKQVFRFLAEVAGSQRGGGADEPRLSIVGEPEVVSMQDLLIHSNPVLEAFGNAKTVRNNNSSRFGKLVTVHFDGSGKIIGAYTRNYLLERTRVSVAPKLERNYHVFYMLLSGGTAEEKRSRELGGGPADYAMLKGGMAKVEGMDDAEEWRVMVGAMKELGFTGEEQSQILDLVAAMLHMGNCEFAHDASVTHGDNAAKVCSPEQVQKAATLLGVDKMAFTGGLTGQKVRNDFSHFSVDKAKKNRDAFVAGVYAHLFDWLVQRINSVGKSGVDDMEKYRFIGVLDIFGFEIFQTNSFEQLCINFANERLQRNFTSTTFQSEEGLYQQEGIAFEHIPYVDNQAVLDLLDHDKQPRGLMQLLEEETRLPNTNDKTLLAKMNAAYAPQGKGASESRYTVDFKRPDVFTVRHYAGDVVYDPVGFMEKSVENVSADLSAALTKSTKPMVALLFTQQSSRLSMRDLQAAKSKKPTVGIKFAKQLTSLISLIEETDAHFIRCIKPNSDKSATAFDAKLTLEQLRYSGVFEAVAIRKCGYPFRLTHMQFLNRYRCLVTAADRAKIGIKATKQTVELLLKALGAAGFDMSEVRVGLSRVFYRANASRALEVEREKYMAVILKLLQRMSRGAICRGAKRRLRAARDGLAAAVTEKKLEVLDAALTRAQTPVRTFNGGARLEFTLHVPNLAEITALQADLREEMRVEASLAEKTASEDLEKVYPALQKELAIAKQLEERLGRPVASMEAAECVCGLSEGVTEHDHERLQASLVVADKLGLTTRLVTSMQRAKAELSRLESGMVYERTLRDELLKGRSKYIGSSSWEHAAIATDSLKKAMDAAVGFPLESKQGLRLIAHASISLEIRALLKADDFAGLVGRLKTVPATALEADAEEVVAADNELNDECEKRESVLEAALKQGRTLRLGEGRWDHSRLETEAVLGAQKGVAAFPRTTAKGADLLAQAKLAVELRTALKACEWASATSWGGLIKLLEGVPSELREGEEVQSAFTEFYEVRAATEAAVQGALDSGRSVRLPAGGWSHESVSIDALTTTLDELNSFPRISDGGRALAAQGVNTILLRQARPSLARTFHGLPHGLPLTFHGLPLPLGAGAHAVRPRRGLELGAARGGARGGRGPLQGWCGGGQGVGRERGGARGARGGAQALCRRGVGRVGARQVEAARAGQVGARGALGGVALRRHRRVRGLPQPERRRLCAPRSGAPRARAALEAQARRLGRARLVGGRRRLFGWRRLHGLRGRGARGGAPRAQGVPAGARGRRHGRPGRGAVAQDGGRLVARLDRHRGARGRARVAARLPAPLGGRQGAERAGRRRGGPAQGAAHVRVGGGGHVAGAARLPRRGCPL